MKPEVYILLLTVFSIVFGITYLLQLQIQKRKQMDDSPAYILKIERLVDWLVIIAVTDLLVYMLR